MSLCAAVPVDCANLSKSTCNALEVSAPTLPALSLSITREPPNDWSPVLIAFESN